MNIKKLVFEFGTVFAVILGIVALVTFLWNLVAIKNAPWTGKHPSPICIYSIPLGAC
jgi:hypothetical protein